MSRREVEQLMESVGMDIYGLIAHRDRTYTYRKLYFTNSPEKEILKKIKKAIPGVNILSTSCEGKDCLTGYYFVVRFEVG